MKLIIDIADDQYKAVQDGMWCGSLYEELKNGIPVEQCVDCIRRQDVEDAIYDYSRSCDVNYAQIMEFIDKLPSVTPQQKPNIKALGEDIRICQKSITDKKVLIGFNMAVALCNKHLAESEVQDADSN
jgi:hypothetical protein